MAAARWRSIPTSTSPSSRRGSRPAGPRQVVEAILYLLWDLGLKVGHSTPQRRRAGPRRRRATIRSAPRSSRRATSGATRRCSTRSRRVSGRRSVAGNVRAFVKEKLDERDARHRRMGDSRYVVEPNVKEGKGGLRDLHTLCSGSANMPIGCTRVAELVEVGLFSRGRAAPVPARRALPLGGALPPPHRRRPRRGTADLRLSARDRGADALCRPARQVAGRALHAPLFPAREDGRRPDRRLPRPSRREVRPPRPAASALPPLRRRPSKLEGFMLDRGRLAVPDDDFLAEDPVRLIQMFALADRYGLEIHPLAMRAAARHAKLIDGQVRADPRANALFLDVLTSPRDPETVLRWMNEAGRVRPLRSRFRPRRRADAVRHVPSLYGRRAFDPRDRPARADRAGRAQGRSSARHRPVQADRVAPRALCRGAAPRHRQGPRRRPQRARRRGGARRSARGSASPTPRPRPSPGWCAGTC